MFDFGFHFFGNSRGSTPQPPPPSPDADAVAFLEATEITDETISVAIDELVKDLKSANIWDKMKAIYPFVGGTATTHKFNLKDPRDTNDAFRLVFNGGWTHSENGSLPNGTNAYANTYLHPNVIENFFNHMSLYSRSNTSSGDKVSIGVYNDNFTSAWQMFLKIVNDEFYSMLGVNSSEIVESNEDAKGYYVITRTANNIFKAFKNGFLLGSQNITISSYSINRPIYIGARRDGNRSQAVLFDDKQIAFTSIGDGLSDLETENLSTAVQKFQTSLNREV